MKLHVLTIAVALAAGSAFAAGSYDTQPAPPSKAGEVMHKAGDEAHKLGAETKHAVKKHEMRHAAKKAEKEHHATAKHHEKHAAARHHTKHAAAGGRSAWAISLRRVRSNRLSARFDGRMITPSLLRRTAFWM